MNTHLTTAPYAKLSCSFLIAFLLGTRAFFGAAAIAEGTDAAIIETFPVGHFPTALTFDGENIWVVNFNSESVTKLRASDGTRAGTFSAGSEPEGITFDGANVWITNTGN